VEGGLILVVPPGGEAWWRAGLVSRQVTSRCLMLGKVGCAARLSADAIRKFEKEWARDLGEPREIGGIEKREFFLEWGCAEELEFEPVVCRGRLCREGVGARRTAGRLEGRVDFITSACSRRLDREESLPATADSLSPATRKGKSSRPAAAEAVVIPARKNRVGGETSSELAPENGSPFRRPSLKGLVGPHSSPGWRIEPVRALPFELGTELSQGHEVC
jgi:hypothetical protein